MSDPAQLIQRVMTCPAGHEGWGEFEDACLEALHYLLVPPLSPPIRQLRTLSGIARRDAAFPNRVLDGSGHWRRFYAELEAKLVVVDFKNYDRSEIGADEVNQLRNYMTKATGNLGIMVCNKEPVQSAYVARNTAFTHDGKVILFLTTAHLTEMFNIKERGDDPADLIADLLDRFRLQHE